MSRNENNVFQALLGARHPIIQAPMAGVTTPELAAAVSNSGALGSLGLGGSPVAKAREQIRRTRALTEAPFNVNFFCHKPARRQPDIESAWLAHLRAHFEANEANAPESLTDIYQPLDANDAMVDMLLEEQPPIVSFHFGLPQASTIRAIQAYGGRVLACVTTLAEARDAGAAKVDALVAQGVEAGGHRGNFNAAVDEQIGVTALVRVLAAQQPLPVIAAGGLMDGCGVLAMLDLGAVGAQLGTAFILCPESAATEAHRAALTGPGAAHTAITCAISGRPARGIVGVFQNEIEPRDTRRIPDYPVAYDAAKQLNAAAKTNDNDAYSPNWAGQGAPLCRQLPAEQLVATLIEELADARTRNR